KILEKIGYINRLTKIKKAGRINKSFVISSFLICLSQVMIRISSFCIVIIVEGYSLYNNTNVFQILLNLISFKNFIQFIFGFLSCFFNRDIRQNYILKHIFYNSLASNKSRLYSWSIFHTYSSTVF